MMFSIEMDHAWDFVQVLKCLEKTLTFRISLKRIFTSSSVLEYTFKMGRPCHYNCIQIATKRDLSQRDVIESIIWFRGCSR